MSETKNAVIKSARIEFNNGPLSAWLMLDYGGSGQGFGGYALYLPGSWKHHDKRMGYAGHFIARCMEIGGVEEWSKLVGKTIRVSASHSGVESIGHIVNDDWFCPSKDFAQEGGAK